MSDSIQPIPENKRIDIVDILRGWALLGVVLGNYLDYREIGHSIASHQTSMLTTILSQINSYLFATKSWTLLSVLFGYGFAVLITNLQGKGKNVVSFFCWRMLLLLGFAFVNSAFWYGDILKDYALLGFFLLLFYKCSARFIGVSCVLLFVAIPFVSPLVKQIPNVLPNIYSDPVFMKMYYSTNWLDFFKFNLLGTYYGEMIFYIYAITVHLVMFTCMLMGFYLQKIDFFNRLTENKSTLKKVFIISFLISIGLHFFLNNEIIDKTNIFNYFRPGYWFSISVMLFVASGICLLHLNYKCKTVFNYFRVTGKMTLTNYMVQNILAALIFTGIGLRLFNTMPFWFYFVLAVFVFIVQLFISKWWFEKFNYGIVEWLWRMMSYRKVFQLKKATSKVIPSKIVASTLE